jgi:hypothetical protein
VGDTAERETREIADCEESLVCEDGRRLRAALGICHFAEEIFSLFVFALLDVDEALQISGLGPEARLLGDLRIGG